MEGEVQYHNWHAAQPFARARRPSEVSWAQLRSIITDLYVNQNLRLSEIKSIMGDYYGFEASLQMYKKRFADWGIRKNYTRQQREAILQDFWSGEDLQSTIQQYPLLKKRYPRQIRQQNVASADWDAFGEGQLSSLPIITEISSVSPQDIVESPNCSEVDETASFEGHFHSRHIDYGRTQNEPDVTFISHQKPLSVQPPFQSPRTIQPERASQCTNVKVSSHRPSGPLDILETAFLPALLVSRRRRTARLNDRFDLQYDVGTISYHPDGDVLWKAVDLLAWLQVPQDVIMLAVIYATRLAEISLFQHRPGSWSEFLLCIKFAQLHLHDDALPNKIWRDILSWLGESINDFISMECDTLACRDFNFIVSVADWTVSRMRMVGLMGSFLQRLDAALAKSPSTDPQQSGWATHREEICKLYRSHKLEDVLKIMSDKHDFTASIRAYRSRLAEWGAKKKDLQERSLKVVQWQAESPGVKA